MSNKAEYLPALLYFCSHHQVSWLLPITFITSPLPLEKFMDHKVRKISLRRFIWLGVLLLISFSFTLIIFVGKTKSSHIKQNISVLGNEDTHYQKLDTCIAILYIAENNIRLYTVTSDSTYLTKFRRDIETVSSIIEDFRTKDDEKQKLLQTDVTQLIKEKKNKNAQYAYLKKLTDSLLTVSMKYVDSVKPVIALKYPTLKVTEKINHTDTIKVTQKRKEKRLFGRLADAIANKNEFIDQTNAKSSSSKQIENSVKDEAGIGNYRGVENYYKQLLLNNKKLKSTERELLFLNASIFAELQRALSLLKRQEYELQETYRNALVDGTLENMEELDYLSLLSVAIIGLLTVIILYNIYRIYRNDLAILKLSIQETEYARMKGEFLATMSHEIRTPLNSVIGFAEQMDERALPDSQKGNLEAIRASSGVLLGIVNDILDFSKFESGKVKLREKPFKPYQISQEMLQMVSIPARKKDIQLQHTCTFDPNLTLLGDAFRMKQVLMNLLSNAIKFTPDKGEVTLSSEITKKDEHTLIWNLQVKDSGIGISKENQAIIFNDFQQIDTSEGTNQPKGTGLGLSICRKIIELAGGKIAVSSELGKGSVFSVSIPFKVVDQVSFKQQKEVVTEKTIKDLLSGKSVLIVDDNKMNLLLLSRILTKNEIPFQQASNGEEAFKLHLSHTFDLIVTDIQMPVMDGVTLAQKVRSLNDLEKSSVPVIGFSGLVSAEEQQRFKAAGMNGLLMKPFMEKDLKALLNEVLIQG